MTRFRILLLACAAALAALALAACGGDDGGGEDPEEVLRATFDNDQQVESGVIDASFDLSFEGEQAGDMSVTLNGPFQDQEDAFSQFDVDAEVSFDGEGGSFSGSGGLVSTGDRAFVNFQGTDYEVPRDGFQRFVRTFLRLQDQNQQQSQPAESAQALSGSFRELSNEGTEDVDGTETTHISGELDVSKLADELRTRLEEQTGENALTPAQLERLNGQLDQLSDIVKNASMDVYSGTEDDILRKLELNLDVESPEGDSLTVDLSLTLSDVNEPQQIAGPAQARPLNDLLAQFGIDAGSLGQLGTILGGSAGAPQTGGSPVSPSDEDIQAWLECSQEATTREALEECASLIQ